MHEMDYRHAMAVRQDIRLCIAMARVGASAHGLSTKQTMRHQTTGHAVERSNDMPRLSQGRGSSNPGYILACVPALRKTDTRRDHQSVIIQPWPCVFPILHP